MRHVERWGDPLHPVRGHPASCAPQPPAPDAAAYCASLCGFPPFYDDNNAALFELIKSGEYDYPSPYWDSVSAEAKDLIDRMLVLDPSRRLSAADLLEHPWIKVSALAGPPHSTSRLTLRPPCHRAAHRTRR